MVTGGFPSKRVNDAKLWCFLCDYPEICVEQEGEWPVIWDAMAHLWRHCNVTRKDNPNGSWISYVQFPERPLRNPSMNRPFSLWAGSTSPDAGAGNRRTGVSVCDGDNFERRHTVSHFTATQSFSGDIWAASEVWHMARGTWPLSLLWLASLNKDSGMAQLQWILGSRGPTIPWYNPNGRQMSLVLGLCEGTVKESKWAIPQRAACGGYLFHGAWSCCTGVHSSWSGELSAPPDPGLSPVRARPSPWIQIYTACWERSFYLCYGTVRYRRIPRPGRSEVSWSCLSDRWHS